MFFHPLIHVYADTPFLSSPLKCFPVCSPCRRVSQQHSDVSVLEFHLERTPLLTSPHPPELTGQSVPPLDFTSSMLSVCYSLASTPPHSLVCMFVFVGPPRAPSEGRTADSNDDGSQRPRQILLLHYDSFTLSLLLSTKIGVCVFALCLRTNTFNLNLLFSVSLAIPLTAYGPMAAAAAAAVVRGKRNRCFSFHSFLIRNLSLRVHRGRKQVGFSSTSCITLCC